MKTKILLTIFFFLVTLNLFAQKLYVPSAQGYVQLVDYIDNEQKDLSNYTGEYLFIYPGVDSKGSTDGDAYLVQLELSVSPDGKYVNTKHTLQIPEKEAVKTTTLTNPSVYGNTFSSDELTGKFVILKYKKKEVNYSAKGILKKHTKDNGYDFYEKTK